MSEQGQKIKNFNVCSHVSFGTPDEYQEAKSSREYLHLLT